MIEAISLCIFRVIFPIGIGLIFNATF